MNSTREAMVINTLADNRPVLDFDPIDLELTTAGDVALPESEPIMALWDAVTEAEMELSISPLTATYSIVWSDDRTPVKILCPVCDDVCNLDDAITEDLPDGHTAMVCSDCLD